MQQMKARSQNRNDALHELLEGASGIAPTWTMDAYGNLYGWLALTQPAQLKKVAAALGGKVRLCTITAYAEERDDMEKRRRIAYHFAQGDTALTVTVPIYDAETLHKLPVPSITPWFRNADWNEREFREMFNIDIEGHPNPKRLFLDERLDAGVMTKLIPFSAMANSAGTNTLWERILEAKGVPPEERLPSVVAVPSEPIKAEFKFTPVASLPETEPALATPTLAVLAKSAEEAVTALGKGTAAPTAAAAPKEAKPAAPEKDTATGGGAAPAESSVTAAPAKPEPAAAAPAPEQKAESSGNGAKAEGKSASAQSSDAVAAPAAPKSARPSPKVKITPKKKGSGK